MRASLSMHVRTGITTPARRSSRLGSSSKPAASPVTVPGSANKRTGARLSQNAARGAQLRTRSVSASDDAPNRTGNPAVATDDDEETVAAAKPFGYDFAPAKVTTLQTRTLVSLFLTYLSVYFVRKPFSVVKAPMQDALGLSTGAIAGIDSAFLSLYAIGQLVLPSLGDRLGAKKMLVAGYALATLTCCAFAFTSNPVLLAVAWGVNGVAQSLAYPLHVKILSPWFAPNQRGTAMGVWATSQQVGGVLSTALAAFLLGTVGWRFAVVLPAVFSLAACIGLNFIQIDPPWCKLEAKVVETGVRSENGGQNTENKNGDSGKKNPTGTSASKTPKNAPPVVVGDCDWRPPVGMAEVLRIPKLGALMASYFFVKIVRYCLIFWLPFYLARECGMGVAAAGYMSCLFDLGGVAGGVATGVIGDKYFAGRRTVLGAYMCAALAIAVLFYQQASQMGPVINGLVMATIGLLVAGPDALLGSSSIADTCEAAGYGGEVLGTASGLVNGAGSVGAVLQGALTAWIASTYGWGALFGTLAVMCVLSVGTLLLSVPEVSKVGGRGRLKTAVA